MYTDHGHSLISLFLIPNSQGWPCCCTRTAVAVAHSQFMPPLDQVFPLPHLQHHSCFPVLTQVDTSCSTTGHTLQQTRQTAHRQFLLSFLSIPNRYHQCCRRMPAAAARPFVHAFFESHRGPFFPLLHHHFVPGSNSVRHSVLNNRSYLPDDQVCYAWKFSTLYVLPKQYSGLPLIYKGHLPLVSCYQEPKPSSIPHKYISQAVK